MADTLDTMHPRAQKLRCEVLDVGDSDVSVQWLDSNGGTAKVSIDWWQDGAFTSVPCPQLEPTCESCGAVFNAGFCKDLSVDSAMSRGCHSCAAIALLSSGHHKQAENEMRAALRELKPKPGDLGAQDALCRHWASVRTAVGLLDVFPSPVPLSIAEVVAAQEVDVSCYDSFVESWKRWIEKYLASEGHRQQAQLRITLEMSRAKRLHGDGFVEEIARRRAEESPAWRGHYNMVEGVAKCVRGMEHVQRIAAQGKITSERLEAILETRRDDLQVRTTRLAEHASTASYQEAAASIEGYSQWYHGSGMATLQEERQTFGLHLPSVSGKFMEDVAVQWLEREVLSLPPLECGVRKVLKNVCFHGVSMPDAVAAEFDAFVVVCRRCDESSHPPKQAGPIEGLWQVMALERWVEVKSNPDELFDAWCRHRAARVALAAWKGYIGFDAGDDGRLWFPQQVFADFTEGVTFVTAPGCSAVVCHASHVPRSLLTPAPLLLRLFQFALDRLKDSLAMDANEPGLHWDYVEELYKRSGEIFMHEGENPEDYQQYLQNVTMQLKELVEKGQVLIVNDPFQACYDSQCHSACRLPCALSRDELGQCISLYVSSETHGASM